MKKMESCCLCLRSETHWLWLDPRWNDSQDIWRLDLELEVEEEICH